MKKNSIAQTTFAAIFSLAFCQEGLAGPDDLSKWLIDEPASLLEVGLLRAELALKDIDHPSKPSIWYDWEEDDIIISGISRGLNGQLEARKECRDFFAAVRDKSFIDPGSGKLIVGPSFTLAQYFSHAGFTRGKQNDEDFYQKVLNKIKVQFFVPYEDSNSKMATLKCTRKLEDNSFSYSAE